LSSEIGTHNRDNTAGVSAIKANADRRATQEASRDRVLALEELSLVWRHAGEGDYSAIVRLLILTGQRREEVAAMTWAEVDLEGATWRIASERTKNARPHEVPLSQPALDILSARARVDGRALVFGSRGPFSGWSKAKAALDARISASRGQAPTLWRLHDIRRTVATRLADLGIQPHVIEAVLNHISGHKAGVAGVYNRAAYATEKRAALDLWAGHVTALIQAE
jgi:integrase